MKEYWLEIANDLSEDAMYKIKSLSEPDAILQNILLESRPRKSRREPSVPTLLGG